MKGWMDMRVYFMSVFLLGFLIISVCPSPAADADITAGIPSEAPSIVGEVTVVTLPMVVVEENPAEPHGSAKANVRITDTTQVLRQGEGVVGAAALQVGQKVKVWFAGPVMESYPLQATAGVIVIGPDGF
jgi:hypothetical protein